MRVFSGIIFAFLLASAGKVFAGDACNNTADFAALQSHVSDAYSTIAGCTIKCLGGESCIGDCIHSGLGVSSACGECFGADATCTAKNCVLACLGGASDGCKACSNSKCLPTFQSCAGVSPPTVVMASTVMQDLFVTAVKGIENAKFH